MTNFEQKNSLIDEKTVHELKVLNDIFEQMNDTSIATFVNLFDIQSRNISSTKSFLKNIIIPKIYSKDPLIVDELLEIADSNEIINQQLIPKEIINCRFLESKIYYIQATNNELKGITIVPSTQCKNKETYIQIIPNGLIKCKEFQIIANDKTIDNKSIEFNSYIKLINNGKKINLKFRNCPQKLFFVQVLFYKKLTINEISQLIKEKLHIPNEISIFKAMIHHLNHCFKLKNLIDTIQKNNEIICPICHEKTDDLSFYTQFNERIINLIIEDNDEVLIKEIETVENNTNFYFEKKVPKILMNGPPLISICLFFKSIKCINLLLCHYQDIDKLWLINLKDHCKRTPIHFACFGSDLPIVLQLTEFKESFDSLDCDGLLPIHYAAMNGNIDVITYLHGIKYNMFPSDNKYNYSPLHFACKFGYLKIVMFYYECIISEIEIKDYCEFLSSFCPNNITPLHVACKYGQNEILHYLLTDKNLARAQIFFNNNITPLMCACTSGYLGCVKSLMNTSDFYDFEKYQVYKSFYYAIVGGHIDIISFILKTNQMKISSIIILEAVACNQNNAAMFLIKNTSFNRETSLNIIKLLFDEIDPAEMNKKIEVEENYDEKQDNFFKEGNQSDPNDNIENNDEFIKKKDDLANEENDISLNRNNQCNSASHLLPIPDIKSESHTTNSNRFIPNRYVPCPFINQTQESNIYQEPNSMQLDPQFDPSHINYVKNHHSNGPKTFSDLTHLCFKTKFQVLSAVENISFLERKSVHITKSEERRIVFKCIQDCDFSITWRENNGKWHVTENGFKEHSCNFETAKVPHYHSHVIDNFIKENSLSFTDFNTGLAILTHQFGEKAQRQTLSRRLTANQIDQESDEYWWKVIPSYLHNNIINGGLSDMLITEDNEVYSFAMLPQYAKLLLSSNAILPVILLDGTFQSSAYRGTLIIVMIVSSNRTNIPIGWSWGPSENDESIKLILRLIKEVKENIETIISDEGTALKAAINEVFPNAIHKLCAWHVSKTITDQQVKKIFWQLLRADHPIIFQSLLSHLFQISENSLKILENGRIGMFSRFFEGVKANDIITSSPCESINSEIRQLKTEMPIKIFHFLELTGYNRCLDLLNIQSTMTPYYMKRKEHIETKAQRLEVVKNDNVGTSRTIIDPKYPLNGLRWEVNTRDYRCDCGKYTDRGFPCAHIVKAFQDLNQPYEQCVHPCYYTATIKKALEHLHTQVPLSNLEIDQSIKGIRSHTRPCRVKRYLFGFEKSQK